MKSFYRGRRIVMDLQVRIAAPSSSRPSIQCSSHPKGFAVLSCVFTCQQVAWFLVSSGISNSRDLCRGYFKLLHLTTRGSRRLNLDSMLFPPWHDCKYITSNLANLLFMIKGTSALQVTHTCHLRSILALGGILVESLSLWEMVTLPSKAERHRQDVCSLGAGSFFTMLVTKFLCASK